MPGRTSKKPQEAAGSGSEDPSPVHDAHGHTTQIRAARTLNPTARDGGVATVNDSTPSLNGDPARRSEQRWPLRTPRRAQYQPAHHGDATTFRDAVLRTTSQDAPSKRDEIGEARTDRRNPTCFGIHARLTPSGRPKVSPPPRRPRLEPRIVTPVLQHPRAARATRGSPLPCAERECRSIPARRLTAAHVPLFRSVVTRCEHLTEHAGRGHVQPAQALSETYRSDTGSDRRRTNYEPTSTPLPRDPRASRSSGRTYPVCRWQLPTELR